jgi:hypothetical protein
MRKYSYESILRTVGRVLDLAEAGSFTVRDTENGLAVEAFDANSSPKLAVTLSLPELAQLLDWADGAQDQQPNYARASASDEGTLRHLLARGNRELVGAH